MLASELTLFSLVCFLFLIVGGIVGWLTKQHMYNVSPLYIHPEMFDENGNIIPDEVVALRFEEGYFDTDDEEDE